MQARDVGFIKNWRKSDGIRFGRVRISPKDAEEFLEKERFTRGNINPLIEKYTRHMKNKTWEETNATIAFDTDCRLVDGHNRLSACVASGIPREFFVIIGIENSGVACIDCGKSRNLAQRLSAMESHKVNPKRVNILSRMIEVDGIEKGANTTPENRKPTNIPLTVFKEFEARYGDGVDFAINQLKKMKRHPNISSYAAIAKAYWCLDKYGVGIERLERFCAIFSTGMYNSLIKYETTALACRNDYFDAETGKKKASLKADIYAIPTYSKMAYYLNAFLRGSEISQTNSRKVMADPFTLPKPASDFLEDDGNLKSIVSKSIRERKYANVGAD